MSNEERGGRLWVCHFVNDRMDGMNESNETNNYMCVVIVLYCRLKGDLV